MNKLIVLGDFNTHVRNDIDVSKSVMSIW